ncbi:MAG TPA: hypothetical protein VK524_11710, partial [Polyangiaceae bacterium]|nr:hypothetical protein [Polyangiaceae bacterium]
MSSPSRAVPLTPRMLGVGGAACVVTAIAVAAGSLGVGTPALAAFSLAAAVGIAASFAIFGALGQRAERRIAELESALSAGRDAVEGRM